MSTPIGAALRKTTTRSHGGRWTIRAAVVEMAKKAINMPRPLHASTTPTLRSPTTMTLPSATAAKPSVWRAYVPTAAASCCKGPASAVSAWNGSGNMNSITAAAGLNQEPSRHPPTRTPTDSSDNRREIPSNQSK